MGVIAESLYVHIPFCSSKCFYCDFAVRVLQPDSKPASKRVTGQVFRYLDQLECELAALSVLCSEGKQPLKTLYVGGGTPSLLTLPEIKKFTGMIQRFFDLSNIAEYTLEVNPEHADLEALKTWRAAGINRVSMGVQSFDDQLLARCGRLHQTKDIYRAASAIQKAGIHNWSLDLMYALPEQSLAQWSDSLAQAIALNPQHMSLYALEIHEKTKFGFDNLPSFSEDLAGEMYDLACEKLGSAGFIHYEVANFCRPNAASQHNQVYWQTKPFMAAGVGAHGYVQGRRYENSASLTNYYSSCQSAQWAWLNTPEQSLTEAIEEFVFLGLRQLERGIFFDDFFQRFACDLKDCYPKVLPALLAEGHILPTPEGIRLAPEAVGLSNRIFAEFLDPIL